MIRMLCIALTALVLVLTGCEKTDPQAPKPLTLFAAASTTDVMTKIARDFEAKTGIPVQCSFAGSSTLARQIEAGASVDIYVSAHLKWIQYLSRNEAAKTYGMKMIMTNRLVWIARAGSDIATTMPGPKFTGNLAIADPDHVPAGIYAKQAMIHEGWWEPMKDRIIPAADVRTALRYVMLGEADAGIVYATDAQTTKEVEVRVRISKKAHEEIKYYAVAVHSTPETAQLLAYLEGPEAAAVLKSAGFEPAGGNEP